MSASVQAGSVASWAGQLNSTTPYGHNLAVTVADGTNRVLFVMAGKIMNGVTATFNGVPMTLVDAQPTGTPRSAVFYLVNPPVGTFNVSVNDTGWQASSISITAFVMDNVSQVTPLGAAHNYSSVYASSPAASTLSSAADGGLLSIITMYSGSEPAITPIAGTTALGAQLTISGGGYYSRAGYTLGEASSIGWTFGGTSQQEGLLSYVINASAVSNQSPTFPGPNIGDQTGTVGTALSANTVSDGFSDSDTLTFTAVGSWPPGVTVSSAGIISGTPTTTGTYSSLSVRATDTAAQTIDSDTFSFTISAAVAEHLITIANSQQVNTASSGAISSPIGSDAYIDIPEFRDWGTGNLQPGLIGVQVDVRNIATGALIVRKTGQTSHATTAVCRVTDPLIPHATLCEVVVRHAGRIGIWELMSI